MDRMTGKVAIVTGGGSGIGRASAFRLAAEGATVVVTDIDARSGKETAKSIVDRTGKANFVRHDVTDEGEWRSLVDFVEREHGKIDILLNNAGIYIIKPLIDTTVEEWNRLMAINVTGTFLGMKSTVPVMQRHGGGSIINLSSAAGLWGFAGHVLYGASKGAVRIMTKDAAVELGPQQIRVNSIHPGYINTGMARYGAQVANTTIEKIGTSMYPLGRIGEPEDVANMVLFLASDESRYVTGAEMTVDGGGTAGLVVGA